MRRFPACVAALVALCGPPTIVAITAALCGPAAARDLTVEVVGPDGKVLATRTVPAACNTRVVVELVTPPRPAPTPMPTPPPPPATPELSVQVLDASGKVVSSAPVPTGGSVSVGGRGVTPTPTPGPQPGPVTPTAFTVVVVEETGQAAGARGAMLQDAALAKRFKDKGHRWRVVDKDVVGPDGRPPADVKPFLDAAGGKALPQLFLVAPDGSIRYKADAPKTPAEMLAVIERYGG